MQYDCAMSTRESTSSLWPILRYDDAAAAIEWITSVAGFELGLRVADAAGNVEHAELWHGTGVVVVMSRAQFRVDKPVLPSGPGMIEVTVPDVVAVHAHAVALGAEVVQPVLDGVVGLSCVLRDAEGNLWAFGTYRPGSYVAPDAA
jgi:uncharacterized glyoxalase superfamily protein PhnB